MANPNCEHKCISWNVILNKQNYLFLNSQTRDIAKNIWTNPHSVTYCLHEQVGKQLEMSFWCKGWQKLPSVSLFGSLLILCSSCLGCPCLMHLMHATGTHRRLLFCYNKDLAIAIAFSKYDWLKTIESGAFQDGFVRKQAIILSNQLHWSRKASQLWCDFHSNPMPTQTKDCSAPPYSKKYCRCN